MKKLFKLLLIALLLVTQQAVATDYVTKTATPTGNFTFSVDVDLGSSDDTISSQNAVKSYVDAHFAPVNGYLLTTRDVPALTNATNLGLLSTGLLKMTVSGGIAALTTAVEGDDYLGGWDATTANYFLAAPNGSAGTPTWRAIVAADIPSLSATYQPLNAGLTSISALTETNGGIPYGTASNTYAWLAAGGAGKLLMGAGAAAPVWTTPTYPNAATTTGAYLRADGTNFIQSTLLLPNAGTAYKLAAYTATNTLTELAAAGTTGQVLIAATGAIPAWTSPTGTGTPVLATSPTLVTPVLGAATATTINGSVVGWTAETGTFTAAPASTSTLTMTSDRTATLIVGRPLKYVIGGVTYYGIVTASASNLLTVAGAPLGGDVTALYYGDLSKVRQVTYDNSASTSVITTGTLYTLRWSLPTAYLVMAKYYQTLSDTHATNGKLTVKINGTETNTSAGGVAISDDATWYSTIIDIATAAYDVNTAEDVTIYATQGTNVNGYGARVNMVFVLP
jgi:hypothetical protein